MMLTQPGPDQRVDVVDPAEGVADLEQRSVEAEDGISEMKNTAQKILSPAGKREPLEGGTPPATW